METSLNAAYLWYTESTFSQTSEAGDASKPNLLTAAIADDAFRFLPPTPTSPAASAMAGLPSMSAACNEHRASSAPLAAAAHVAIAGLTSPSALANARQYVGVGIFADAFRPL